MQVLFMLGIDWGLLPVLGGMARSYFKQEHDIGIYCVKSTHIYFGCLCEKLRDIQINGFFCLQRREERRLLGLGKNTQTGFRWELVVIFHLQLSFQSILSMMKITIVAEV